MNELRIKDLNFAVSEAVLLARISADEFYWSISIDAKYPEGRIRGEVWEPKVYSENLFPLAGKALDHWRDILGRTIEWDDCYDLKTGDPIASVCVFEHLDIYKSKLTFGEATGGDSFKVDWRARCDVYFDDDYGEDLELSIQTEVKFAGVEVPFQDEVKSQALLRQYIRGGNFTFDQAHGKYDKPIFRPV